MKQNRERINILGVQFHKIKFTEAVDFVVDALKKQNKASVFTPNPEIVIEAYNDKRLLKILNDAELIIPDGIGVVLGSKIIGKPLPERVAGYDVLQEVFKRIEDEPIRVFFYGSAKGVAELAAQKMKEKYPKLQIVGVQHGYIKSEKAVIDKINAANVDLLLVGLGAPRQEYFISKNRDKINAKVYFGCGGSFDGMAGVVKRAPKLFIRLNLEWFYRLIKQPTRAKRMLRLPLFLVKIIFEGKRYK